MTRRQKFAIRFHMAMMRASATVVQLIIGKQTEGFLQAMIGHAQTFVTPMRARAAENGKAREFGLFEDALQQFAQSIPPDSQWVHHKDIWNGIEVVVLPRVMDSNTGVVTGPAGHPDLGAVVTNDGQTPNCDPHSLNFILNGPSPVPPTQVDAEFLGDAQ